MGGETPIKASLAAARVAPLANRSRPPWVPSRRPYNHWRPTAPLVNARPSAARRASAGARKCPKTLIAGRTKGRISVDTLNSTVALRRAAHSETVLLRVGPLANGEVLW